MYSLGLLIIEMASGEPPWGMETPFQKAMDLAVLQKKRPPIPTFLSRSVRVRAAFKKTDHLHHWKDQNYDAFFTSGCNVSCSHLFRGRVRVWASCRIRSVK